MKSRKIYLDPDHLNFAEANGQITLNMDGLKTGDIVLFHYPFDSSKPMSYIAAAIREIANIEWNHVGVVVKNWGEPFLNEAVAKGVISSPAKDRLDGQRIRVIRPKFEITEKDIAVKSNSVIGYTGYDFRGLLIDQLIFQLFGVWVGTKDKKRASEKMYCYEYVGWIYNKIFPKWWMIDPIDMIDHDQFKTIFQGIYKK